MKLENGNYQRPIARYSWWLGQSNYFRYMMRELSSLFIGIFSIMMVWGLYRLSQGESAFNAWTNELTGNSILFSLIMFVFAIYHSFSWFAVTPKAMPIKMNGKRVAGEKIVGAHLTLWLVASIVVWFSFVLGGGA